MDPGRKVVENEFSAMVQNRLPGLKSALPVEYDYIDGGEVGVPLNFFARVFNAYTPFKINGKVSPEKQYLYEIEYDATPTLRTDGNGNPLPAEVQSEILNEMGRSGKFKKGIQRVMKRYPAKEFRRLYREAERAGTDPDSSEFASVYDALDRELRLAVEVAMSSSKALTTIQRKARVQETVGKFLKAGMVEEAKEYMNQMEQKFSY